jgi:hypothetical protein
MNKKIGFFANIKHKFLVILPRKNISNYQNYQNYKINNFISSFGLASSP